MRPLYTLITVAVAVFASLPTRAANRYWIAAAAAAWNNTANWSTTSGGVGGASIPGAADVAIFDNNGLGNASIPTAVTVSSLVVNSGYTGTISQGAVTVTISGAATFSGGTFTGSASSITFGGTVTISGATLTLPAQVNMNGGSWTYTSGSLDAFTNSSNVTFAAGTTITGSQTFNNLTFTNTTSWPMTYTMPAATILTVNGNIATTGTQSQTFTGGTINLLGNLSLANTATGGGGTTVFAFAGTGNQAITGTLTIGQSALPAVNINKASGTLTLPALITEGGSAWTYTAGTIDATTNNSTVDFINNVTITGSHTLNNITFSNTTPWSMTYTLAAGTTLSAAGTVTFTGSQSQTFTAGTIDLLGNLSLANTATGGGGTTVLAFVGTGNQAITGTLTLGQDPLPSVSINKASGTLSLPSLITMAGTTWSYTAGTVDATTNNSTVAFDGNTTISGSQTLNNIQFDNSTPWTITYTLSAGTTLSATGRVTLSGTAAETFTAGTLDVLGNLTLTNTSTSDGGTTVFAFAGTTNQTITSSLPAGEGSLPSVNINKTSGTLQFPAILTMAGSNWTYTTGALDVTTNNSNVVFGGNTTITGSHTLNNVTFSNTTSWPTTITTAAGTVLTVSGTLSMTGASAITLTGGTIDVLGNLSLANTSTSDGGTTVLAFTGTTNQTISSSLPINENALPSVNINKASGTLQFPAILTMAGSNWTYTTGTLDVTTNNSTVVFGGNTTITGSHTLNNVMFNNATSWPTTITTAAGTVLTVSGTLSMGGASAITLTGGTVDLLGNLSLANTSTGDGGTTVLLFGGTTNQTISSSLPVNENSLPSVNINKPGGTLQFPAILTMAGSNWTYTTGTLDVTTNNSTVYFGGNTTITGSHTLNNVAFNNATSWPITLTTSAGTVLTVSGTLSMSGASAITLTGGTIDLQGNLNLTNTATGDGGTTVLAFTGTTNQTITSSLPVKENSLPAIAINKPSGTLTFPSILTVAGNAWTYTAGTVDATTDASTVYFTNAATINSNGMSFYNFNVLGGTSTLGNNLTVNNNLTITSPGVLSAGTNTINLLGNWSDWASAGFNRSTSTVNFAGTALQTITAPGGEIFANATVNNSGAGIQLENNVTVYKALTMTQGNIDLNTNTLTIGQNAANPGSLTNTAGTIVNTGSVTRWIKTGVIATGSTAGLFPVGTTADPRTFTVTAPTTGPTTGGTITVSYTDAVTNTAVSFPDAPATVQVRKNLNWAVSTGNGLNGGNYSVQLSGTDYGQIGSVSDLRVTLVNSVVGTAGVNGGTTADPLVNRTGLSVANLTNTFFLGSINPGLTTLPVTILSFGARPAGGEVVLGWTATLPGDNAVFTIQRSQDGQSWDSLLQVEGQGAGTTAPYTATDAAPLAGTSYYRLMMTEADGAVSYSSVAVVNLAGDANPTAASTLSLYPNPVVSLLTITNAQPDNLTVSVFSELGQVMMQLRAENAQQVQLNVSGLAAGVYFVRITGTGWMETRKIVVRR